jgi:hypothetical protein
MRCALLCPGPSLADRLDAVFAAYPLRVAVNRAVLRYPCSAWVALDWKSITLIDPPNPVPLYTDRVARETLKGRWPRLDEFEIHEIEHRGLSAVSALHVAHSLGATSIDVYGADWTQAPDSTAWNWLGPCATTPGGNARPCCGRRRSTRSGYRSRGNALSPLFVSYFTFGTQYEQEVRALEVTLREFGLEHRIEGRENRGDWRLNCAQKADFIWDMMKAHPGRPIVWVDADARIMSRPVLFDELDCDVAYHLRHGVELLSGTVYFGPTAPAQELVMRWIEACKRQPEAWDQLTLAETVEEMRGTLRIQVLPFSIARFSTGSTTRSR